MFYTVNIYNSYSELVKFRKFWAYDYNDAEVRAAAIAGELPNNWHWTLS